MDHADVHPLLCFTSSVPVSHGPSGVLEELQGVDCDGNESGDDSLGLVQSEGKPAAA